MVLNIGSILVFHSTKFKNIKYFQKYCFSSLPQFIRSRPAAYVSFVKTTVASKWRMADFVLHGFFELPPPNTPYTIRSSNISNIPIASTTNTNKDIVHDTSKEQDDIPTTNEYVSRPLDNLPRDVPRASTETVSRSPEIVSPRDTDLPNRLGFDTSDPLYRQLCETSMKINLSPGEVYHECPFDNMTGWSSNLFFCQT